MSGIYRGVSIKLCRSTASVGPSGAVNHGYMIVAVGGRLELAPGDVEKLFPHLVINHLVRIGAQFGNSSAQRRAVGLSSSPGKQVRLWRSRRKHDRPDARCRVPLAANADGRPATTADSPEADATLTNAVNR